MADTRAEERRTRGWLLINSSTPHRVAWQVNDLFAEGGDEFVVVRADVVESLFDLLVPIDAKGPEEFKEISKRIEGMDGVELCTVIMVVRHYPNVPHNAHGYVTENEQMKGKDKRILPGRQTSNSPGANPWG